MHSVTGDRYQDEVKSSVSFVITTIQITDSSPLSIPLGPLWIFSKIHGDIRSLKVGTNENGSACGRWLSIGIYFALWWSTFIFILIRPPCWNNSIPFSAYYSRLNRHRLNDKAWCCKYLRHFSFLNIFLFAGGSGGGGSGAKPHCIFGSYLHWWERGWAWSHISRHKENMEFYN